jgi:hypothetical protein
VEEVTHPAVHLFAVAIGKDCVVVVIVVAILRDVLGGWLYLLVGGLGVLGEARNGGLVLLLLVGRILVVGTIHRRGAKERVQSGWLRV